MDFDVIIVGAGPGGSLAARDLARGGFKVALFDALAHPGAHRPIIVEVERPVLEKVGVRVDEEPYRPKAMQVLSPAGLPVFRIQKVHEIVSLYMDRFVPQLVEQAVEAGAQLFARHEVLGPLLEGKRVTGVEVRAGEETRKVTARLVIDASGFNAVLVKALAEPLELGLGKKEQVVMARTTWHKLEPTAAAEALRSGRHGDEEIWNRIGMLGPYSTVYTYVSMAQQRAYLLVGRREDYPGAPLEADIARFKEELGFYGEALHGGAGRIRLGRPLLKPVADGFMAIGEAARQVVPIHASGVSSALFAGHLAARVAGEALKRDDTSTSSLWPYAYEYHSGRGAVLASLDGLRWLTERITSEDMKVFFHEGAVQAEDIANGLVLSPMRPSLASMPRRLKAVGKRPKVSPVLAKMGLRAALLEQHFARYPRTYKPRGYQLWQKVAERLWGE